MSETTRNDVIWTVVPRRGTVRIPHYGFLGAIAVSLLAWVGIGYGIAALVG